MKQKYTEISGISYLNNPCERCRDGELLRCSEPCLRYAAIGHVHECPDCGRKIEVGAEVEIEDKSNN